jgi:hypothetical protein
MEENELHTVTYLLIRLDMVADRILPWKQR